MIVIPAIDVKGGKCVQLVGGKPGTEKVEIEDVMAVARKWESDGAEIIHIIDLDAALGTGNNESLIEMLAASLSAPVQVGGGVRTEDRIRRLFKIGAERVIIGTRAIKDREFVEKVSKDYPEGIVVAIDAIEEEVLIDGWQTGSGRDMLAVVKDLEHLPIWGFLYTNVAVEGRLEGIEPKPIQTLIRSTEKPVMVSGGITTMTDLVMLDELDAHSAVVGMAIYTGKIDFRKAVGEFK
jgi:phosphoribosylformimino-5-aminoimidazole carboxamide ribotide isomerase